MRIELKSLKIKDWKGFKNKEIQFNGHNTAIIGTNETGKTTIADAYRWLLFDKSSSGDSQFGIKPLDTDNNEIHHLNSIVEGEFEVDDKTVVLKKDYHEVWKKKRGTSQQRFSGHTTDHYIDEEPVKKSDYEDYIDNNFMKEDIFKLITDPLYFNEQLHWEDQKEIIFNLVEQPDPGDIAARAELYYLVDNMGDKTAKQHQTILKSKMTKINNKIEDIQPRIDEIQRGLSVEGLDYNSDLDDLTEQLEVKKEKRKEIQKKIAEIESNQQASKKQQLINLKEKYNNKKEELNDKAQRLIEKLRTEKNNIQSEINKLEKDIDMLKDKIPRKQEELQEQKEKLEELSQEHKEWEDKEFSKDQKVCPTCGQELPEGQIEEHRQEFNKEKANKLEEIKQKGKDKQRNIKRLENAIENMEKELEKKQEEVKPLQEKTDKLKERINNGIQYKKKIAKGEHEELENIQIEIDVIKEEIEERTDSPPEELDNLKEKLKAVDKEIGELDKKVANLENIEKARKRINELEEKEKNLAEKYEQLEQELYDTEKYIKQKVEMMEDDVNDLFEITEFKLFEEQVNGAITETCEALKDGVPFSDMNTGSKYQVGMDIINVLSDYYDIEAPVFIDNRERIAKLPNIDSQTIHLVMSPKYQVLEIIDLKEENISADKLVEKEVEPETLF